MKRYYIQVHAVMSEGYDEAESYEEILALARRYKEEEEAKRPELGKMWFDIEEVEQDNEV